MTILRAGSKGTDVENLQVRLRRLQLFDGAVTGKVGASTVKAVKAYEKANGLTVDGFVTEKEAKLIRRDSLKKVSLEGLERGDSGLRVKDLQHDLAGLGFFNGAVTGKFNEATRLAVKKFERANKIKKPDGVADLKSEGMLDRQMAKLSSLKHPKVAAPPSDYHRTVFRGGRMNVRTKVMLQRAELYWKGASKFSITQGSYSKGVSASAGTHDGGGALDISVRGKSAAQINQMVKSLRKAGFAAWQRTPADGFSSHIHAIAIGDREAAPLAKQQVQSYFNGRNGLRNNALDRNRNLGRPYPTWAQKFDR